MSVEREKIAIVGGGVAGIVSAYLLQDKFNVSIFEKADYLGGHTNTFTIQDGPDKGTAVDTGFIVLNDKTYPNLHRFFKDIGVQVRYSDMSFGFYSESNNLQYSGRGLKGLFAQKRNLFNFAHLNFIREISRFSRLAVEALENNISAKVTLGEFLAVNKLSQRLQHDFVIPMGAAIWSAKPNAILDFPASTFLRFFYNHGLLSLKDRPRWQTVVGGSQQYVKTFRSKFKGEIYLGQGVREVNRANGKVEITFEDGKKMTFDRVIMATHADITRSLIKDQSEKEKSALAAWEYQENETILHFDQSQMPPNKNAWASWNYRRELGFNGDLPLSVTYDMNRLQGLKTKNIYLVTLNTRRAIDPAKLIYRVVYHHPIYNRAAIESQHLLRALNGESNTYFCGSYFGYGFHEDATKSAYEVVSLITGESV